MHCFSPHYFSIPFSTKPTGPWLLIARPFLEILKRITGRAQEPLSKGLRRRRITNLPWPAVWSCVVPSNHSGQKGFVDGIPTTEDCKRDMVGSTLETGRYRAISNSSLVVTACPSPRYPSTCMFLTGRGATGLV